MHKANRIKEERTERLKIRQFQRCVNGFARLHHFVEVYEGK